MARANVSNWKTLGARFFWAYNEAFARRPGAQNIYCDNETKYAVKIVML